MRVLKGAFPQVWRTVLCCIAVLLAWLPAACLAQVNSGSNGSDGAFNPATDTIVDMNLRPNGIYHYTSVYISNGVDITFIPNANNTPVVWLVQSNCVIKGTVSVSGKNYSGANGGTGGPGGWRGGSGGNPPTSGEGPGGGLAGSTRGAAGSFGTQGNGLTNQLGAVYGNPFLLPLQGGSGGAGIGTSCSQYVGGGGGGGAILIAATGDIQIDGTISANGGDGYAGGAGSCNYTSGGGSGGGVRLVCTRFRGTGSIAVIGGGVLGYDGGFGRARIDTLENLFGGSLPATNVCTVGFQPIILPIPGQGNQLTIVSVAEVPVSASPSGVLAIPDAIIAGQQANPITIEVRCSNIPLHTPITVAVKPANSAGVSAVGYNNTGTQASSTAWIQLNMPRGGGLIYATATTAN